jgi:hypoxanthine phosphoribosyltransferase
MKLGIVDGFLEGRKFVRESLIQMKRHSKELAEEILRTYGKPGQIVYIERGGMIPARLLSDMLMVKDVAGINASYYLGVDRRASKVSVGQMPKLKGGSKYLLLVDDVADTGKTLRKVADAIRKRHNVRVATCTIFYKPQSEIRPDFYAKAVGNDKWIIFEYEETEFGRGRR